MCTKAGAFTQARSLSSEYGEAPCALVRRAHDDPDQDQALEGLTITLHGLSGQRFERVRGRHLSSRVNTTIVFRKPIRSNRAVMSPGVAGRVRNGAVAMPKYGGCRAKGAR